MYVILILLALHSSSILNNESTEYQIEVGVSQHSDQFQQNDFGDPPTFWIVWVAIINTLAVIMIIYFIYRCCKKSKEKRIADATLINQDDSYHDAIPPTIPQQTNQETYPPYQEYYQQPYQNQYHNSEIQNQYPYQQPVIDYQQPSQSINVF